VSENNTNGLFDEDFCVFLEYHLSAVFQNADRKKFGEYWCDGAAMPPWLSV
jgi:hypothetical protein